VGGLIISRDADGFVQHHWIGGLVGACANQAAIALVWRVQVHASSGIARPSA
jgi:hypothetical protein